MKKNLFVSFLCAIIILAPELLDGQNRKIDSLRQVLKAARDTNRINALNDIATEIGRANPDTAIIVARQALVLSRELNWEKGEAWAEFGLGTFNYFKTDLKAALVHYNNAMNISNGMIS